MENNQAEECECGHEESDHTSFIDPDGEELAECVGGCKCQTYSSKDAQYYADLDYDARTEKYERSRE